LRGANRELILAHIPLGLPLPVPGPVKVATSFEEEGDTSITRMRNNRGKKRPFFVGKSISDTERLLERKRR
jgi:hypothetical protein